MSDYSIRRQARLRREYLYRKSLQDRQSAIQRKKDMVKSCIQSGKELPTDLKKDGIQLMEASEWDDEGPQLAVELGGETTNVDDEYRWAGVNDPKIVITTSRDPSSKLKQFAKEMKLLFPNSQRINRGNYENKQLIEACRQNNVTDFIVIHETRGQPDALLVSHLPHGPTAFFNISDVVMRHDIPDIGTMSEQYPHLVFHNFKTKLGERVTSILKYLFPVPKEESKRVISFINLDDFILFRHHNYRKNPESKKNEISEVGPRFTLKLFKIVLGTLDQETAADTEFVLRPYMNTGKKRRFLSDEDPWKESE